MGSGGTSKTARVAAENLGAKTVFRVSRSGGEGLITYKQAYECHTDCEIIINTTPCGMYPNVLSLPIDFEKIIQICEGIL